MKYCSHCGAQIEEEAVVCVKCGCATETRTAKEGLNLIKIFMLIGCIFSAWCFLIPLCWTIPMTVHYWRAADANQPVSTGFKVCSLIFVSPIAGILMLCNKDSN